MREKILDIYFLKEYGKLCQAMGEGRCNIFEWKSESGMIKNMFIMRPVPWLIHGVQYYDIVTPYGYGGPMIFETNNGEKLKKEYTQTHWISYIYQIIHYTINHVLYIIPYLKIKDMTLITKSYLIGHIVSSAL